jgi:hypothetical protein
VEYQRRLVGHDGLRQVLAVSAPERQPDEVVVDTTRQAREPVEPGVYPLITPGRDVVVEMGVAVPHFPGLLGDEIAALTQGLRQKVTRDVAVGAPHGQSFNKLEEWYTTHLFPFQEQPP